MTTRTPVKTQKPPLSEKKHYLVVVDGNPAELFSTGMILQRLDYTIFTAGSAEDCLRFMEIARPSAIITELLLPKMSGMDLLSRVKQDPQAKDIPVIIHTHMKDPKVEELCMVAGCASFLRKPVEPNTLYRSIQFAIEATPRHYIRFKTCLPVLIDDEAKGSAASSECVTALSENGIYIRTNQSRPVNSMIPITILIPGRRVKARAMVLYCITGASGPLKEPGLGMKFVEISGEDREFIKKFIEDEITRDLAS
ncbi:MAG TPA: response regulator [Nitrospirota bacterium]|nr:response regulator [Nitrospirota bacterium]